MDNEKELELKDVEVKEEEKPYAISPSKVKTYWDSGEAYKRSLGLQAKWKEVDNFINGNHWSAIPKNQPQLRQMSFPVLNVCGQIATFKGASVKSENVKMIFSPFGNGGATGDAFGEDIQDLGDLLTKLSEVTWERCKMDTINGRAVDRALATGIGITYFYFDKSITSGVEGREFIGDIRAECLDAMYVGLGNPQELDLQKQPYIITAGRMTVKDARKLAKANGAKKEEIEKINSDESDDSARYSGASFEVDEAAKINVFTLFWKENGLVHYVRTTESAVLEKPKELKLKLYPFAKMNWKERIDCIYGMDEVSPIIPNQRLINGLLAMNAMSIQLMGFPKMIVDTRYIDTRLMTNTVGEMIRTKGNMPLGFVPISYLQPAQGANNVPAFVEMISQKTKDISGANDAITGEANTNNASAIMLLQKSSGLPNEDIRRRFYQFIEDEGAIILDFYRAYYDMDRIMQYKKKGGTYGEVTFNAKLLDGVDFTIRSDVGASTVFGDPNTVSTLDKLVQLGMIDKVMYLKYMPKGVAPFKEEMMADFKLEAELKQKIQEQMGVDAAGNPVATQEPQMNPIEQEMTQSLEAPEGQRLRLEEEYGQEQG